MALRALAVGAVVGAVGLGGTAWWAFQRALTPVGPDASVQWLTVRPGSSVAGLAAELEGRRLIRSRTAFQLLMRLEGADRRLQAGVYELKQSLGPRGIVALLAEGRVAAERFTVPEGYALKQIAALLEQRHAGNGARFLALKPQSFHRAHPWLKELPPGANLEGLLFPDTYVVPPGPEAPEALAALMLARFQQVGLPVLGAPAPAKLSWYQALTMASIVEKEAVLPEERPIIAGVFYKRLATGMPFGSDPTVEYALGLHQDERGLSLRQVAVDSPYNTYKHAGLPPGPIANPGLASLKAAMQPADTPYLYFVAEGGGKHRFTKSYAEHLAAQRQILAGQR